MVPQPVWRPSEERDSGAAVLLPPLIPQPGSNGLSAREVERGAAPDCIR